jgi:hypothetical protein
VFDGHGGPGAAEYVQTHLFVKLENDANFPRDMAAALSTFSNPLKCNARGHWDNALPPEGCWPTRVSLAENAFLETDSDYIRDVDGPGDG